VIEIKICGLTNAGDAAAAARAGADYLGFVFYPRSPRAVQAGDVARILDEIGEPVRAVGVFVNETPETVLETATTCRLHAVQLHGDESPDRFEDFPVEVWRALRVSADSCEPDPKAWPALRYVVDALVPGLYGGSGVAADWEKAAEIAVSQPVILAGGLTAENVAEAIHAVRPRGVDVSSGVERSPGRKSIERLGAFIARARDAATRK